jgi:mannose/fructose/N-acetylgalactosamine-specific phosphotransferase system component IID
VSGGPVYPEITRAQWAVLSAWTDQRCQNMMEAADFVADLSPEAKAFLKSADKQKVRNLNANLEFYANTKAIWRFLWIGGSMLVGAATVWKTLGDYISVKFK